MLIPQSQLRVPPRLPLLGVLSTQFSLRSVRFGMLPAHAVHPLAVLLARVGPLLVLWTQTTPSLQPAPVNARRTKPRARLPKRNGRLLRTRLMLSPTPTPRTTPWMVAIPMWRITLHRMPRITRSTRPSRPWAMPTISMSSRKWRALTPPMISRRSFNESKSIRILRPGSWNPVQSVNCARSVDCLPPIAGSPAVSPPCVPTFRDHFDVYKTRCEELGIVMHERAIPKTLSSQNLQGTLDGIVVAVSQPRQPAFTPDGLRDHLIEMIVTSDDAFSMVERPSFIRTLNTFWTFPRMSRKHCGIKFRSLPVNTARPTTRGLLSRENHISTSTITIFPPPLTTRTTGKLLRMSLRSWR
ncbi:hypothetical protein C8R43DRAFT_662757 [Mycena crocata]|nr:hypothetical protein C8R43DRAFT_662757 [Mycena crocata]